ncbi:hypothetical protein ACQR18_06405 [Bradyrhizobium oligotrophicum]|uniref:hypothetical protein n=1 Tax=Bradyrhizobium oligotrophicum TaxID=44255 RepID=UPI003EBDDE98
MFRDAPSRRRSRRVGKGPPGSISPARPASPPSDSVMRGEILLRLAADFANAIRLIDRVQTFREK